MEHIERALTKLEKSFGKPRQAVDIDMLHCAYGKEKSVPRLVKTCAQAIFTTGMPRIRVGVYRSGAPVDDPAWLVRPAVVPPYGSRAFCNTLFTVGFQASFVKEEPFPALVFATAHELSHIVLHSVDHALRYDEKAVDLTAMYFGYAEVYAEGKRRVVETWESTGKPYGGVSGKILDALGLNQLVTTLRSEVRDLGYLSREEMHYACSWIVHRRQ
jgi:hypothetical protein